MSLSNLIEEMKLTGQLTKRVPEAAPENVKLPRVECSEWVEEAEAALCHIRAALDMIGARSDTVPLIVHRAEMELKRAIATERRASSTGGSELRREAREPFDEGA
jgi:hypothetical protein